MERTAVVCVSVASGTSAVVCVSVASGAYSCCLCVGGWLVERTAVVCVSVASGAYSRHNDAAYVGHVDALVGRCHAAGRERSRGR